MSDCFALLLDLLLTSTFDLFDQPSFPHSLQVRPVPKGKVLGFVTFVRAVVTQAAASKH